jgi:gamma-glutamyl hydrolase
MNATHDYIAASYVKWIEAGGGRSIVIPYGASTDLLDEIWTQINGILLPGGAAEMPFAVRYLLDRIAHESLDPFTLSQSSSTNDVIPVWGTCLGFEFLIQYFGGGQAGVDPTDALQSGFVAENVSWPLLNVKAHQLYHSAHVQHVVQTQNVTLNNHHQGIEPDHFALYENLTRHFHVTSTNVDDQGRPFVSTMEPKYPARLPIYGVQYHPEKNAFEYATYPHTNIPYEAIDHSSDAVQFALYLAQFFVRIVTQFQMLSLHSATLRHEYTLPDRHPYIYAYPIEVGVKFEQMYIVPKASYWAQQDTMPTVVSSGSIPDRDAETHSVQKDTSISSNSENNV